jgi:hypothetical protein
MSRLALFATVVTAVAIASPVARSEDNKPPAGFTALFTGKNLDGWQGNVDMKQRTLRRKSRTTC